MRDKLRGQEADSVMYHGASRKYFWQGMYETVMHRLHEWLGVRGQGYRIDPYEKPGVRWVDWCTILPAWLGCFSGRGAWDPLTVTGSVETGCRESGLFFLVLVSCAARQSPATNSFIWESKKTTENILPLYT